jgi:hypothetical protein
MRLRIPTFIQAILWIGAAVLVVDWLIPWYLAQPWCI